MYLLLRACFVVAGDVWAYLIAAGGTGTAGRAVGGITLLLLLQQLQQLQVLIGEAKQSTGNSATKLERRRRQSL